MVSYDRVSYHIIQGSNPFANMGGQPATQAMHGGGNRNQQPVNLLD